MTYNKVVRAWLITGCVLVFFQIFIGGVTRITGSGLSITKWEIVTGTLPPMTEEVGELARLMARQYGEQSFKTPMNQEQIKDAIADELSDVMFVITCLANQMDIDIEKAIEKNFKKKTRRDATRHQDNSKL